MVATVSALWVANCGNSRGRSASSLRAQERGLDGYPVFTRKAMTDLNYVACARLISVSQ